MYMQTSTYHQEDHYYPYGGLMGESTSGDVQRYKYNGKELNRIHNARKNTFFEYDFNRSSIDKRKINTYSDLIINIKRRL